MASISLRLKQWPWVLILFSLAAILLTARNFLLPSDAFGAGYTHYNNYLIFKHSFFHLLQGKDLYQSWPAEQFDLFKYTPTFALAFGALAWMPDWLGLACWNLLNAGVLYLAIQKLPNLPAGVKLSFGLLLLQELITSTMNSQSNALIAGLLMLAWVALEEGKGNRAVWLILCTAFIKLFGILFFILFLFYPKFYRHIWPAILLTLILVLLPMPFTGFKGLTGLYQSYLHLLQNDGQTFVKYSVAGWLKSWFHLQPSGTAVLLAGFSIQLPAMGIVWLKKRYESLRIRALLAASLLIWLVIFNHMAESATFVIAVAGVLVWFFYSGLAKPWRIALLLPVILFTCFGPSDIYPKPWRVLIVEEWQLKVFPCILAWAACMWELLRTKPQAEPLTS